MPPKLTWGRDKVGCQTTLDLYTDEDLDEMIAAQEKFLSAVGFESGSVQ
jgi:hypothetical protein